MSNSIGQYILTFVKTQEDNWGDIEKVFQETHLQLWFMYRYIVNTELITKKSRRRVLLCYSNITEKFSII